MASELARQQQGLPKALGWLGTPSFLPGEGVPDSHEKMPKLPSESGGLILPEAVRQKHFPDTVRRADGSIAQTPAALRRLERVPVVA